MEQPAEQQVWTGTHNRAKTGEDGQDDAEGEGREAGEGAVEEAAEHCRCNYCRCEDGWSEVRMRFKFCGEECRGVSEKRILEERE